MISYLIIAHHTVSHTHISSSARRTREKTRKSEFDAAWWIKNSVNFARIMTSGSGGGAPINSPLQKWQLVLAVGAPVALGLGYMYYKNTTKSSSHVTPAKSKASNGTTDKQISIDGDSGGKNAATTEIMDNEVSFVVQSALIIFSPLFCPNCRFFAEIAQSGKQVQRGRK